MYSVRCSNSRSMEYYPEIEPLLQSFANIFKTNVNTFCPHGRVVVPKRESGELKIIFYAAYGTDSYEFSSQRYPNVFGIRLQEGQRDGITPSKKGIPIYDQDNLIAEYVDGSLFVLFDLMHSKYEIVFLMAKILENFVIQGLMKNVSARRLVILQKFLIQYQKYISSIEFILFFQAIPRRLNGKMEVVKGEINSLNHDLIIKYRQRNDLSMALNNYKEHPKDAMTEIESLKEIPEIDSFSIESPSTDSTDKQLVVLFTKPITIEYQRTKYKIGSFKIEIDFSGQLDSDNVKCTNLTRKIEETFDHPHINNGSCCFGNIEEVVPELIASYSLADLARLLICYLQSYTRNDKYRPYRNIEYWPIEI